MLLAGVFVSSYNLIFLCSQWTPGLINNVHSEDCVKSVVRKVEEGNNWREKFADKVNVNG